MIITFHILCIIILLSIISITASLIYGKIYDLTEEIRKLRREYEKVRRNNKKKNWW